MDDWRSAVNAPTAPEVANDAAELEHRVLNALTCIKLGAETLQAPANHGRDQCGRFAEQIWHHANRLERLLAEILSRGRRDVMPPTVAELPSTPDARTQSTYSFDRQRVLVIDDDDLARHTTADILADAGLRVEHARSGFEAEATLARFSAHLIVCDIVMPGLDGLEFVRRLRCGTYSARCDVPAVAITGVASQAARQHIVDLGFFDCLIKPFTRARLLAAAHKALVADGALHEPDGTLHPTHALT